MIYSEYNSLEDLVIQELSKSQSSIKRLHKNIETNYGKDYTLRAVYKIVNLLIKSGVLIKAGKNIHINREWVDRVKEDLLHTSSALPQIKPGESVTYSFNNMSNIDIYWKTLTAGIEHKLEMYPIFLYNPHDFWLYIEGREENELKYYSNFEKHRRNGFFVIGGNTALDKKFKADFSNDYFQIDLREIDGIARTDHVTIIGEYVITVRLGKLDASKIDDLFKNSANSNDCSKSLNATPLLKSKIKFKTENNPSKAKRLRKKLSKNFYIPRELVEKYDLF